MEVGLLLDSFPQQTCPAPCQVGHWGHRGEEGSLPSGSSQVGGVTVAMGPRLRRGGAGCLGARGGQLIQSGRFRQASCRKTSHPS